MSSLMMKEVALRDQTIERLRLQVDTREKMIALRDVTIAYHEFETKRLSRVIRFMFWSQVAMSVLIWFLLWSR